MKRVIAIDGPSGAGKSTIARMVAEKLGYGYLDTGALYRAVALNLVKNGLGEDADEEGVAAALEKTKVEFLRGRVYLNSADVSDEIRSARAGHFASVFSVRPSVRTHLLAIQRDAASRAELVAEGRDMTTVVFPDAYVKIYMDASVEERARRRSQELAAKGFETDPEQVRCEIIERDARDSGREIAPLRKAPDAFTIDTTGLSIEQVCDAVLEIVKRRKEVN